MTDPRINLVVLFGGQSAEHDVSCTTAAHVLRAADPAKYRITPIGISRNGGWAISTDTQMALEKGSDALPGRLEAAGVSIEPSLALTQVTRQVTGVDAPTVVMPLLHGPLGEDGTVQGMMELANVPYVGAGVLSSALAMDKAMAKQVAAVNGLPQARYVALRAHEVSPGTPAALVHELGLPLFVKPSNMGSSVGVTKAKTVEAVRDAIDVALSYDEWVVIEEAINGREIEVAVLGNLEPRASVPGEIVPGAEFYDYADKYIDDGSRALIPAPLTAAQTASVQAMALKTFKVLRGEGLSRVDFFLEESGRGFLFNEMNTMPGFTPISMYPKMWIASGLSYSDLIDELVRLAIERHGRQRRNTGL